VDDGGELVLQVDVLRQAIRGDQHGKLRVLEGGHLFLPLRWRQLSSDGDDGGPSLISGNGVR
jgi:hypothetical protein